jgi:hypothetical protein
MKEEGKERKQKWFEKESRWGVKGAAQPKFFLSPSTIVKYKNNKYR